MTETPTATAFSSPRLERPQQAPLAGVALALAATTGTSPVLWRVLFLVLIPFGGIGLLLYLLGWAAIPKAGEPQSLAQRLLQGPDRTVSVREVLLLVLLVLVLGGAFHDGTGVVLLVVGVGGYLLWRRQHPEGLPPAPPATPPAVGAVQPPVPGGPAAPRPRSVVTALALSTAALVVGALLLVAATGAASVPTEVLLASALAVVGVGLVVAAVVGRGRGLVPVALVLGLALAATAGARPAVEHGIGERQWFAQRSESFRLGIGEATLALAPNHAGETREVAARIGIGHLVVVVPEGVRVVIDAHVGNGRIEGPGVEAEGRDVDRTLEYGTSEEPAVHVEAQVGAGFLEVRRG